MTWEIYLIAGLWGAVIGGIAAFLGMVHAGMIPGENRAPRTRPDWDSAPPWARFAVRDVNAKWWWIDTDPHNGRVRAGRMERVRVMRPGRPSPVERRPK